MRTPDFERRVTETLEQHGLLLVAITKVLHDQKAQTATTNERLERIVELLTPEEGERASGPSLAEALLELAAKVGRGNALTKDLAEMMVQGLTELPQAVAEAILEAEADAASGRGAGAGGPAT